MSSKETGGNPQVVHVVDTMDRGGIPIVINSIMESMTAQYQFAVIATDQPGHRLPSRLQRRSLLLIVLFFRLLAFRARGDCHILHVHQRAEAIVARMAFIGVKMVRVEHVHNTFDPTWLKIVSFRYPKLIACGTKIGQMLERDFNVQQSRIEILLNASRDLRRAPQASSDQPTTDVSGQRMNGTTKLSGMTLLCCANVNQQKNPGFWLGVVALVRQAVSGVEAVWVGDGPLLEEMRREAALAMPLTDVFVGYRDDVSATLHSADAFLLLSRNEGLPMSAIEAMSAGLPVFANDVGSVSDAVKHGVNGLLFSEEASAQETAHAIVEALRDPDAMDSWGKASRRMFEDRFSLHQYQDRLDCIYKEAPVGRL